MANSCEYLQDNFTGLYSEGPFVLVSLWGSKGDRYRIQVQSSKANNPVLPDESIYKQVELWRGRHSSIIFENKDKAEEVCNRLNEMVYNKQIVQIDNAWIVFSESKTRSQQHA